MPHICSLQNPVRRTKLLIQMLTGDSIVSIRERITNLAKFTQNLIIAAALALSPILLIFEIRFEGPNY